MGHAIGRRSAGKEFNWHLQTCLLVIAVVLHFFLEACARKEVHFEFVKVAEITLQLPPSETICNFQDLALDARGNFYIVDNICHRLWVLTKEGKCIRAIGGQGQGPGELQNPASVAIQGDTLAILEAGNSRLSFFSLDGIYHSAIAISSAAGHLSGAEIGKDGRFIVSESLGVRGFDFFDGRGAQITQHPTQQKTPITMPVRLAGGHLSSANDGTLLFSSITKYYVLRLNWNGDTLVTYQANPSGYHPPDLSSRERLLKQREWAILGVPLQLKDRTLVQWFNRKPTRDGKDVEWERYADLFTYEGQPLALGIPSPHVFLCSKGDLLYAVDTSSPDSGKSSSSAIVTYRLIEKSTD